MAKKKCRCLECTTNLRSIHYDIAVRLDFKTGRFITLKDRTGKFNSGRWVMLSKEDCIIEEKK